jgi:hypothetical protein
MENEEIITIQNTRANKILSNMKKNKQKGKKYSHSTTIFIHSYYYLLDRVFHFNQFMTKLLNEETLFITE